MTDFNPKIYPKVNPYVKRKTPSLVDPRAFDALIRDHGVKIIHESATLCPCYYGRIESGQKSMRCTKCENGYLTYDSTEIFAYLENTDLEKNFQQFGVWDSGSAHMYTPSKKENGEDFYVGYFDRITILDFVETYCELIQKEPGDRDRLKFKALDVITLRTENKVFTKDIDFKLDDDGNILWTSGNQPTYDLDRGLGEVYTIKYLRNPIYRVMEIFQENRYVLTDVREVNKIPKRLVQECIIKKDYLITKTAADRGDAGVEQG